MVTLLIWSSLIALVPLGLGCLLEAMTVRSAPASGPASAEVVERATAPESSEVRRGPAVRRTSRRVRRARLVRRKERA